MDIQCRQIQNWNAGHTPADERIKAPFGGNWSQTLKKLETEISHVGGTRVIIELSGDVRIRQDGWPYANESPLPPIAISFNSDHGPLRYSVDRYDHWHRNVHAIALTLERLRAIDRYGTTNRAEQYTGFAALPAGSGDATIPDPIAFVAELLGLEVSYLEASPVDHVRQARKLTHPDSGGLHSHFLVVQQAAKLLGVS